RAKPQANPLEEVQPDLGLCLCFAGSEEDGTGKDTAESIGQTAVMRTILRQSPFVQNLAGAAELDRPALSANGLSGNPERDQPILSERQAVIWMADNFEEEAAVPT